MEILVSVLIGLVAAFHLYVMWLEMFAWTTRGPKVFSQFPKDLFPATKTLAANQGLYNGFLAAGLIWSYFICNPEWQFHVRLFFLGCVAVAGIYGGFTASKKIFFVQGLPAVITIVLMHFVPFGCHEQCVKPEKEEIMGFYIGNHRFSTDTLSLKDLNRKNYESKGAELSKKDSVVDTIQFEYINEHTGEKSGHVIVLYSNQQTAPIDGDIIYATLDDIGVIYGHALSWGNFNYLHTTSDSLNSIISVALSQIIANRTYAEQKVINEFKLEQEKKKVMFIPLKR